MTHLRTIKIILIASMLLVILYSHGSWRQGSQIPPTYINQSMPIHSGSRSIRGMVLTSVCINEFLPAPKNIDWDGDGNATSSDEWIELYNPLTISVNLTGWYLSDGVKDFTLDGKTIAPQGYLVIYRCESGITLGNSGDEIFLYNNTTLVDHYSYTTTSYDRSYGRRWDGTLYWTFINIPTPNASNNPPTIVINEVCPNPIGSDRKGGEWLEIYNAGPRNAELSYWYISDQDGEFDFAFPSDTYLNVSEYAVVVFGNNPPSKMPPNAKIFFCEAREVMDNKGDDLVLYDRGNIPIDYLAYGNSTRIDPPPPPQDWDGLYYNYTSDEYIHGSVGLNVNIADEGDVLIRVPNGRDTNSALDFISADFKNATPGRDNDYVYYFEVNFDADGRMVPHNTILNLTGYIENLGNVADSYSIEISILSGGNGWSHSLVYERVAVSPSDRIDFTVTLVVPNAPVPNTDTDYFINALLNITSDNLTFLRNSLPIYVYTSPCIYLTEVIFDPPGSDAIMGEWIEIKNLGSMTIDLDGYTVTDSDGTVINLWGRLPPGGYALITTLPKEDIDIDYSSYDIVLCGDTNGIEPFLTSTGDDLTLYNPYGYAIDHVEWGNSSFVDPAPDEVAEYYYDIGASYSVEDINRFEDGICGVERTVSLSCGNIWLGQWRPLTWNNRTVGWNNSMKTAMILDYPKELSLDIGSAIMTNITIENKGTFVLNMTLSVIVDNNWWSVEYTNTVFCLSPGQNVSVPITIIAPSSPIYGCMSNLSILLRSVDVPYIHRIKIKCYVPIGDLTIDSVFVSRVYTSIVIASANAIYTPTIGDNIDIFRGEKLSFEIKIRNTGYGDLNHPVNVSIALAYCVDDFNTSIQYNNLTVITTDSIDFISKGRTRSVTMVIDTKDLPTNAYLLVCADFYNQYEEEREWDNTMAFSLNVTDVGPDNISVIKIKEVFPGGVLKNDRDEFVSLLNTAKWPVDLSHWYLTDMEGTIVIPEGVVIPPGGVMYICQDSEAILTLRPWINATMCIDIGKDIEYSSGRFSLSSKGDEVLLFDRYWRPVDTVIYGSPVSSTITDEQEIMGWNDSVFAVLIPYHTVTRMGCKDTNTSADFLPETYMPISILELNILRAKYNYPNAAIYVHPDSGIYAISDVIARASRSITMASYVLGTGEWLKALFDAINRGIDLNIYVDGSPVGGMGEEERRILNILFAKGAKVFVYGTELDMYRYMHSKFIVIDNRHVYISTENFVTNSYNPNGTYGNRGFSVFLENVTSLAMAIEQMLSMDVETGAAASITNTEIYDNNIDLNFTFKVEGYEGLYVPTFCNVFKVSNGKTNIILSPDTRALQYEDPLLSSLRSAMESIDVYALILRGNGSIGGKVILDNPYLWEMYNVSKRGVKVRILLDTRYTDFSDDSNIAVISTVLTKAMVEGNKNITFGLFATPGLNCSHSKAIIIDTDHVYIGSMNLDVNSIYRNREIGILLHSNELASYISTVFDYDWQYAIKYNLSDFLRIYDKGQNNIKISKFYYDGYMPFDPEEFIAIYNNGSETINLCGVQITDEDYNGGGGDATVMFPEDSFIQPKETIYIARNPWAFKRVMGFYPDYYYDPMASYNINKRMVILDPNPRDSNRGLRLANTGDNIIIGSKYYRILNTKVYDSVYYGNFEPGMIIDWKGDFIPDLPTGRILKRRTMADGRLWDCNSMRDWDLIVEHRPGQSAFLPSNFTCEGKVTVMLDPFNAIETIMDYINSAEFAIDLNVYEFTSMYIAKGLLNAINRGVNIRILVEGAPVGGLDDHSLSILKTLSSYGAEVHLLYSRVSEGIYPRYRYDHAKYMIIDGRITIVLSDNLVESSMPITAGFNIDGLYFNGGSRGWGIAIDCVPLAEYITSVFNWDFNLSAGDAISLEEYMALRGIDGSDLPVDYSDIMAVRLRRGYIPLEMNTTSIDIYDGAKIYPVLAPDYALDDNNPIFRAIDGAEEEICLELMTLEAQWTFNYDTYNITIINPYLDRVLDAARRGVRIRILLDSAFSSYDDRNSRAIEYINEHINATGLNNIEVRYHYADDLIPMIHNKGMIIDSSKVLISSINWVKASPTANREIGLIIESKEVGRYFKHAFMVDWNRSYLNDVRVEIEGNITRTIPQGETIRYFITAENRASRTISISFIQPTSNMYFIELNKTGLELGPGKSTLIEVHVSSLDGTYDGYSELIPIYIIIEGHMLLANIILVKSITKDTDKEWIKGITDVRYMLPRYATQLIYISEIVATVSIVAVLRDFVRYRYGPKLKKVRKGGRE